MIRCGRIPDASTRIRANLSDALMHWCIDKKRDEKPLPPLHKEVLSFIPDAPETISSKLISYLRIYYLCEFGPGTVLGRFWSKQMEY